MKGLLALALLAVASRVAAFDLRGLVFESNVSAANDYYAAHRGYLARYGAAAMKANGVEDIRRLGAPVAARSVQPRLDTSDADGRALQRAWARQVRGKDERAGAYQAISNRMKDLTGEQRPGTLWLGLAAELSVERGAFSVKRSFDAQVTQYGTVRSGESSSE